MWKQYPLILITGRRNGVFFHSEHRQIPWLREISPDPTVELHPDTAKALGVIDGEWVWIEGVRGRIKRKVKLTPIIHRQMAHASHGWWLPETDGKAPNFYNVWDLNVNLPHSHGPAEFVGIRRSADENHALQNLPDRRRCGRRRSAGGWCAR